MSVIKTFRGEEPKPRKLSQDTDLQNLDYKNVDSEFPDLKGDDVVAATTKLQAAYRGYQTRKKKRSMADVIHSALVIQAAFRRYKARKEIKEKNSDLPDLKADDVVAASIKIQAAYKGFMTRKLMRR